MKSLKQPTNNQIVRAQKGEIAKEILKTIGVTGLLITCFAMPGLTHLIPLFIKKNRRSSYYRKTSLERSLANVYRRGFVHFVKGPHGYRVELTAKGRAELTTYELRDRLVDKPRRWDKKWRLLIFDIEETRRMVRDKIRRTIEAFGFYRLQNSVWVYPYECEEVLELLRTQHAVRHNALFIRAETITNDTKLRRHFELPI